MEWMLPSGNRTTRMVSFSKSAFASSVRSSNSRYDLLCSTCKYDKLYRCEFDVVGEVTYGSSEGIYGDIFLYGNWSKERDDPFKSRARVYVLKTLKQDKESYLAVGMLVNLICYYANEFVATHLDRFD